jgi:competence ComEA-like helix-hairpin-helix protein
MMRKKAKIFCISLMIGLVCGLFSSGWAEDVIQKININTATVQQLMDLKGVGEVLAQRIVEYRTQNGPFASVNDLEKVNGIGPKILSDNATVVTVGDNDSSAKKTKLTTSDKTTKAN